MNCFYTFTGLAATVGRNNTHFTLTDTFGGAPPKVIRIPPGNYFIQPGSPEIVNSSNAGTMTKGEIRKRDKTASKVKARPIKGDTEEESKHRIATFITLRSRGKKKKK